MSIKYIEKFKRPSNAFSTFQVLNSYSSVESFFGILDSKGFWNWAKNIFNSPKDAITSLRVYPFTNYALDLYNQTNELILGGSYYTCINRNIKEVQNKILVGKKTFPNYENFEQYEPYTQLQLYLPYIDFVDLPINELSGKTLYIYYMFDLSSGTATASIEVGDEIESTYTIATKSGRIGYDISWGASNNAENTRNIITTLITTAISLTTLNLSSALSTKAGADVLAKVGSSAIIGKAGLSVVNSLQLKYQRGGTSGSMISSMCPNHPYLIWTKQKVVDSYNNDYLKVYGKPLYLSRTLSTLSGFTQIDEIHLTGFKDATSYEIEEIERLLKTGVIL